MYWYVLVCTSMYLYVLIKNGMYWYVLVCTVMYLHDLILESWLQHAYVENIKTVANLSNNKDVFMFILCFHARAGYLQHYKALLKELNDHLPYGAGPHNEPGDQYSVEHVALADRNHNLPSETGLLYPSLVAIFNWHLMTLWISVTSSSLYQYVRTY